VLLQKGDPDGAEASYRAALAIDPGAATIAYNIGLARDRRGDLAGAEEWYRKAVAAAPARTYFREVLDNMIGRRARLGRLDAVAAGRADPATPAEAIELAELAHRSPRPRYGLAAQLYRRAFAADPALADDLGAAHRYSAAWCAALAAAGKDEDLAAFGVEEWGHLTGLALTWLRADFALLSRRANDAKQRPEVHDRPTFWKADAGLASVRDPAWLAAMPPADRPAWERLWGDVDALLAGTRAK